MIEYANETFAHVGLVIKEWVASKDGASVDIGGISWFLSLDTLQNKITQLHFGQKKFGLLGKDVKIFRSIGLSHEDTLKLLGVPKMS